MAIFGILFSQKSIRSSFYIQLSHTAFIRLTFQKIFAVESGIYGIRVVNIRSAGITRLNTFQGSISVTTRISKFRYYKMKSDTMLKQMPVIADIANITVFLASDVPPK